MHFLDLLPPNLYTNTKKKEDYKDKPIEEWTPRNRVEMDGYRKRLVEIITASSVSAMNSYKWEPVSNLNYNIEINQLWMVYR
jgi:hypothetical protein